MDSVRSEYSDTGSALGSSHGVSSSGVSFLDASSVGSSRASSSTTRTDFLSNYEHKFLERKTAKKKKKDREKRLADATSNQLTADDKRRADREAERLVRKAEMATWLPSDAALRQRDTDRKKRSRDRMRTVLRWYPPLVDQEEVEAQAHVVGMTPAKQRLQRTRQTEIAPLFAPHAQQAAADTQQHRALCDQMESDASALLQRRVAELQLKMACLEQLYSTKPKATKTRQLVPLASCGSTAAQSVATLPPYASSSPPRQLPGGETLPGGRRRPHPTTASTSSFLFRDTPLEAAQAFAVETLELDAFLDTHRRHMRRHDAATHLQATWRMVRVRRKFRAWHTRRLHARRAWFQLWTLVVRITKHAHHTALRKGFRAWRDDVASVVRLRTLELRLFRAAERLPGDVSRVVRNLVLMADDDDDAYTRKALAHPLTATGFVNAAFASVEQHAVRHGVRHARKQHLAAKRAVAKKIVQRLFLQWKRVHADAQRSGLNAQLCIKRAARQAFQKRPVWAGEKLLTVLELWARYAAFARSKRLGVPLPHFPRPLPLWDVWLHNYQERQIRAVKAGARAPLARMRRCFQRAKAYAAVAHDTRVATARATRHDHATTTRRALRAWRHAIAYDAAQKKRLRLVCCQWFVYAHRKASMRPWKQQLVRSRMRRAQLRAWRAWRHVQLRSCFTRELHCARLVAQPAWRWKVQRVLLTWMDVRAPLHKWKCFVAWRHCVQRRKLWVVLQRHCATARRRHVLYGVLSAWKAVVWKQEDAFLEDRLQLSAWDAYRELSPLLPMLFYGRFSDAAALFGGVASSSSFLTETDAVVTEDKADVLGTRQRALRAFHAALVQGSVIEARNLILNQRHLLNGVDDATGNTALHVAVGQLEDPVRRVEITTLLLSEGACSVAKRNRHGLTPPQLAADETTRRLLVQGVYAFHAQGALQTPVALSSIVKDLATTRLVWCLVARMSSEYVKGDRVGSDVRRAWHSELRDELWLRRGRVCFAATSAFAPAIHRCRAFLNGMKRRICCSKDDAVLDLWTRVQRGSDVPTSLREMTLRPSATRRQLSRDLARVDETIDLLAWLKNTPDDPARMKEIHAHELQAEQTRLRDKAASLGEYSAYAEALLWPVLQDEPAERELVHSFVGVVFSLSFPVDAVLAQAARLERECTALESDVLHAYQGIMRAELRSRAPDEPHGLPLLRFFTEQADAEFFFKRELLLLHVELLRGRPRMDTHADDNDEGTAGGDADTPSTPSRAKLQLDADVLLAKAQRKQRKVDKKVAQTEQRVATLTDVNTRVLLTLSNERSQERLRGICDARTRLEDERLRLAQLRLKQFDWVATIQELLTLKRSLDTTDDACEGLLTKEDEDELLARRAFLQTQLVRYTQELRPMVSTSVGGAPDASTPTTELRRLHKVASTALWALLVRNLFRACCCWLAENLLQVHDDHEDPWQEETTLVDKRVSVANLSEPVTSVVATTFAAARKASAAVHAAPGDASGGRRRSSLSNARATLDTMQRSAAAAEGQEIVTSAMRDNYESSSQLLFERDRDALQADETRANERARNEQHQRRVGSAVVEMDPTTGLPETPSSRLLDVNAMEAIADALTRDALGDARETQKRNRKRELMRRAMAQRQLQRLACRRTEEDKNAGDTAEDTPPSPPQAPVTVSDKKWAPLTEGVVYCEEDACDVGSGTFVAGSAASACAPSSDPTPLRSFLPFVATTNKTVAAALAESMWKRGGGTVRRHGDSHAASVSLAGAPSSRGPSGSELFASAEDEMAFNTAFRVMSASKERKATPSGRRLSAIGAVTGSGLDAVSPRDGEDGRDDASPGGGERDVSTPLLPLEEEEFNLRLLVEEAEASGIIDAMDEPSPGKETHAIAEQGEDDVESNPLTERVSPPEVRVVSTLAALVTATDETEFFDQTLQHYLDRVRRDSFIIKDPRDSAGEDDADRSLLPAAAASVNGSVGEADVISGVPLAAASFDAAVDSDSIATQWRTPHVKWEPPTSEPNPSSPPRPLHVESTRLLVPVVSVKTLTVCESPPPSLRENAVLADTLRELERNEADERRLHALQKQPLLLSGTTTAMAARRRKTSVVASTLLKKTASLKKLNAIVTKDHGSAAADAGEEESSVLVESVEASPSVPKILVAVQRKLITDQPAPGPDAEISAPGTASNTVSSPMRRLSQQKPMSLPHCELQLEPATKKTRAPNATKFVTTSRRRTTQVDSGQSSVAASLSRQPSRLLAVAPVEFCLKGASALGAAASESKDPHATATVDDVPAATLPVLTEEQKRNVWRDFTVAPLSDTMQDAYAQMYPALYAPATPLPTTPATPTVLADQRRPSSDVPLVVLTVPQQIALDKRFWSAVEGFKSVGTTAALVLLDDKTATRRRVETAVAIYQQFLSPTAPSRLVWLSMYGDELRSVERRLLTAPRALFDALQQQAQLHISTLQSQVR